MQTSGILGLFIAWVHAKCACAESVILTQSSGYSAGEFLSSVAFILSMAILGSKPHQSIGKGLTQKKNTKEVGESKNVGSFVVRRGQQLMRPFMCMTARLHLMNKETLQSMEATARWALSLICCYIRE